MFDKRRNVIILSVGVLEPHIGRRLCPFLVYVVTGYDLEGGIECGNICMIGLKLKLRILVSIFFIYCVGVLFVVLLVLSIFIALLRKNL